MSVIIRSTGLWKPEESVSNEELVACYNAHVERFNAENADAIAAGTVEAKSPSSTEFIEKASGIKSRYTIDKDGVLNLDTMAPRVQARPDEDLSLMAEAGAIAARAAMDEAGLAPADIDGVICSATSMQRTYPCMAIEIQDALGIPHGFGFDMTVACSSGTFGIVQAINMIETGMARRMLVVTPEITTPQLNFRDRDSHFIFGDVSVAMILEAEDLASPGGWKVLGRKMMTRYSNNIRSNFGFLNRCELPEMGEEDVYFVQQGRKVFKEVCPMVAEMILEHMDELDLTPAEMKRLWLHQANINMNMMVAKKVFGRDFEPEEAPVILDEYANTAGAGSLVAFHSHHDGFEPGEKGLICSFGAGYSAGTVFVEKR